jgi:hypothetical protein
LTPQAKGIALVAAVAVVSTIAGCVAANMMARPDAELLVLVERLLEADRSASIVAVGMVAATAILAAVLIPLMTIFAVLHHERNETHGETTYLVPPGRDGGLPTAERLALDTDQRRSDRGRSTDRAGRDVPARRRPRRRALGPEVPDRRASKRR